MCLMLYLGTAEELPVAASADLRVERLSPDRQAVRQWFSQPAVQFVGAHTGCSCGFPSVIAEAPIEYYDGMPLASDDRDADLRSVRALVDLIRHALGRFDCVELYPVADGEESAPPRGVIEWRLGALDPERLFFNERFLHIVRSGAA
jgi:hypothetical protein